MKIIRRAAFMLAAPIVAGGLMLAGASAASASPAGGNPGSVTANLSVPSTLTLTMNETSFSLTGSATSPAAVTYSLLTNNPAGAKVFVSAGSDFVTSTVPVQTILADTASAEVHYSEPGTAPGMNGYVLPEPGGSQLAAGDPIAGTGQFSEDWTDAVPAAAAPGAYTMALSYLAVAS